MSLKKRIAAMAAALIMATGAISTIGTSDAMALGQGTCNSANGGLLWLYSNATTCWGGVGSKNVNLYSVYKLTPGSNTGWIMANGTSRIYYWNDKTDINGARFVSITWPCPITVTTVTIDSSI